MESLHDLYKKRDDALREKFDSVAGDYEKYRLTYPDELYEDIFSYCPSAKTALEIGIGTGKGTRAFLEKGLEVLAVEPNAGMLQIAADKYRAYDNLSVLHLTFEELELTQKFDLIYAASAFQWIKSDDRLDRVFRLLNYGGCFARFKTTTVLDGVLCANNSALERVYLRYLPSYLPRDGAKKHMSDAEYLRAGFENVDRKTYYRNYAFSVENYIHFIRTYTEYISLEESVRNAFEKSVRSELNAEESVLMTQKCTLVLAGKNG